MESTGHDFKFVDSEQVLAEFLCVICRNVAKKPNQATCCGILACQECCQKLQTYRSAKCPHCREDNVQYFPDKKSDQKINALKVYCKNRQYGCMWEGELSNHEQHFTSTCNYNFIECSSCFEKISKANQKEHLMNECRKRMVKCQHCHMSGYYCDIVEHEPNCPEQPIDCPNGCQVRFKRKFKEEHRRICSNELVRCQYYNRGCEILIRRSQKEVHEENCSMQFVTGSVNRPLSNNSYILPIDFKIDNFSDRKVQSEIWQHSFWTGNMGYYMSFEVYTNGCRSNGDVSCYIKLQCGHFDCNLSWPFRGVFVVELINQSSSRSYHKHIPFLTSKMEPRNSRVKEGKAICGIGEPNYISGKDLPLYLDNDSLHFRIRLENVEKFYYLR